MKPRALSRYLEKWGRVDEGEENRGWLGVERGVRKRRKGEGRSKGNVGEVPSPTIDERSFLFHARKKRVKIKE